MAQKSKQIGSFRNAVSDVPDGATIAFGGFAMPGVPFNLIEPPGTTAASVAPAAGGEAETLGVAAGGEVPVRLATPGNYVVTLEGRTGTRELTVAVNPGATPAAGAPASSSSMTRAPRTAA